MQKCCTCCFVEVDLKNHKFICVHPEIKLDYVLPSCKLYQYYFDLTLEEKIKQKEENKRIKIEMSSCGSKKNNE